jgi:hypothetical protein
VRQAKAKAFAADLAPTIAEIQQVGITSLAGIAAELTARAIPAPRGGSWRPIQVARVLERLN